MMDLDTMIGHAFGPYSYKLIRERHSSTRYTIALTSTCDKGIEAAGESSCAAEENLRVMMLLDRLKEQLSNSLMAAVVYDRDAEASRARAKELEAIIAGEST